MITKAIFDSGVFIGSHDTHDQYALQATDILKNFRNKIIHNVYLTDYIVVETVNFILKRFDYNKAKIVCNLMLNTEDLEVFYMDKEYMASITENFHKYKTLSITDCSLIALSEKLKIREIFSFDKHFDSVKGITRLTSV